MEKYIIEKTYRFLFLKGNDRMKKTEILICIGISVLLFTPAYFLAVFGIYFVASLTGLLIPSYVVCFLGGGALISAPFIVSIGKGTLRRTHKVLLSSLFIILFAGLLFAGLMFPTIL